MRNYFNLHKIRKIGLFVIILFFLFPGISDVISIGPATVEAKITQNGVSSTNNEITPSMIDPKIQAAIATQNRYTPWLMAIQEVIGTATGLTENGRPAILAFTKSEVRAGIIPSDLESVPVVVITTGEFVAMHSSSGKRPAVTIDPKSRFSRPVPIGVSTGNAYECSAGTIGARATDGTNVYSLSNNHVYARENNATVGEMVLQPGLYDTGCIYDSNNVIGNLTNFKPIIFSTSATNTVDAAIALSSTANLGNQTPSNGYGTPKSITAEPALNMYVQKYGRTTALTKGIINGINATINVGYGSGTARFVNQIVVYSRKPFIKPGDSGSLLVTDPDRNPVGLLFAGSSDGKWAIANPIREVLDSFSITIDGE
ncbi:MAG: hypothetical protein A2W53_08250 [Nitrospinae bacterium RIFCSPHIGHO2_02_39_11]|nr:MAG: hypothetical protein A2W53_08250 [Nitrospinae bacterium RIFCSPHIGHO2_02_39_11]